MKVLPSSIETYLDQDKFLQFMLDNLVAYHPDEDAHDYVIHGTGTKVFTHQQASTVNRLSQEALAFDCDMFWTKALKTQVRLMAKF